MGCLTDVPGVRVAHLTLRGEDPVVRTGVTAVLPRGGDLRAEPVTAAVHVINGYGKPLGLAQVAELGTLETPIVLTGTLSVGAAHEGVVRHLLARDPDLGRPATVNPVVLECNDGRLNDLRTLAVRTEHVEQALEQATSAPGPVAEGAVGAGHGMVAFGWKGGIGTASTRVDDGVWSGSLGTLVLTNMGRAEDLLVDGRPVSSWPADAPPLSAEAAGPVAGSVVVLLAADVPLDARQLGRLARRAQNGLARCGIPTDHGSGEFVLAWSTTQPQPRRDDAWLRPWFGAVAEIVEAAVRSSLRAAATTSGRDGVVVHRCPVG